MRRILFLGLALYSSFLAAARADSVVVFNEIMYHPATNEPVMEWVELYNQFAVDVDLTGWSVTGGINFDFPSNTVMKGRSFLLIAANPQTLAGVTGLTNILGPFTGRLNNAGDTLRIRNNSGRIMDEVSYGADGDWPVAPDGSGVSLAKADRDLGSASAANWRASDQMGGTPGTENFPSGFVTPSGLVSYWNFNEATGPALDSIGVNHGTVGTGVTRAPSGGIGGALVFNGTSNAFVNVGPGVSKSFSVSAGLTIEAVLQPGWNGSGSAVIFRKALKPPVAYRDAVLTNNPVAYWRLNDSTTNITDSTANGHNGAATAGMLLNEPGLIATDPANNAVRGTGSERITIPGFEKIGSGYTVEFWIKPHQLPTGCCQCLVGDGESSGDYFLMNYINGPQQGLVGAIRPHFGPGNSPVSMDAPIALQVENVYHVVTTWDVNTAANNAVIYYNGVAVQSGTITRNLPAPGTTGANGVYIGHDDREVGDGSYTYDEVAIYNHPLTAADVNAHYFAATATNFAVDQGNAIQLAFQNDGINGQANPPVASGPVLSFGITVGGVYSELDMPLDGQAGRPTLADLTNNAVHHVAASYNSATGVKAIFVDGVLRFSTSLSGALNTDNGADAVLGNSAGNGVSPFAGTLDEMTFWGRGLSASEVAAHWTAVQAGRNYFAPTTTAAETKVAFNEVSAATNNDFLVELINYGTNTLSLDGFVLQRDGTNNSEYVFPSGTSLSLGGFIAVTSSTLGFQPDSGDKLLLLPPDRSKVLDAVVVKGRARARFPDGTGAWLYPASSTAGGANAFAFHNEIVINEIMYNHASLPNGTNLPVPSSEEWLELFNRGATTVDLTGWTLDGGISYAFAAGQTLAPGAYLVVAKDTNALRVSYPAINMVGNYSKKLSTSSDLVVLKDPMGNPANQVRYFDSGRWPEFAAGGGSSLELRDPNADNSKAEAWAASDESGKSSWNNYSYKITAQNLVGPVQWNDFILGLLSSGECLVDDVSVIESPTTTPVEFISNGNFENGLAGWRVTGTHNYSRVEIDPTNPGNHVLHVVANGPQEHMHNHIETTYAGGRSVVNGREYQISFKAKWIAGNNLLNTRLYFDRVARTTVLPTPALNGTPGAQNSRFAGNIGPAFSGFQHRPVIPQAGEAVTVTVDAADPQGVASCQVWWSVNGGAWNNASMINTTNARYSGTIPGQSSGTIQFFVQATDGLGAISTYPARGSNSAALYAVNDGQANLPLAHNVRVILSPANTAFLHAFTNVMSNETLPCTVIYDEKRAYYDMGVRLKGSERGRYSDTRVSFHLEFNPDDLFRGVHPVMLIDRSGAGDSTANKQQEIVIKHMLLHAGNIPGTQPDLCRLIAPLSVHTGPGIFFPRHEDEFIATAYGSSGTLYELELIYYPTTADAGGYKNPQPDNVTGVDITDLGNDKEQYRYDFIIKNHRDVDDYGPLMRLGKAFSLPSSPTQDPALDAATKQVMDVDEWLRAFALVSLCGVGDSYTFGNNHNLLMYTRPSDGRMLAFPWDMDFSFNQSTSAPLVGDQNWSKVVRMPSNLRRYYAHMLDIIGSTYNSAYITYWANHYDDFCPGQNFSGVPAYVQARGDFAISTINSTGGNSPFAVNGGPAISVSNNLVIFTGTAPVSAITIKINGIEYPISWSSIANWTMSVPVSAPTTSLVFQGFDLKGNAMPGASNVVTVNYSGPPVDPTQALVINEILYRPAVSNASFVEIFNRSTNTSFDLSGWRVSGIDYTFPDGTIITNRQYLVLAKDSAVFTQTYGVAAFGHFDGNLDPEGEKLALIRPIPAGPDQTITAVHYESTAPWPNVAPGTSLQLIDASQENSRVSNWADGSGWRFFSLSGVPGPLATNLSITLDIAGDFYADDFSLVAGSVPAAGANLLQNGDFESGLLSPWYAIGNHAASSVSTAVHHSGNASLHLVATGAGSVNVSAVGQPLSNVSSNSTYTLSFWYLPGTNVTGFNWRLTSAFRTTTSISLRPATATPAAANSIAAPLELFPAIWINEIQPNNVSGILDNHGEHDPWIELYNSGSSAIALDGFSLANGYSNPAAWAFPNGTVLNAGEFKVVFVDGQPGQSAGNELHTAFRLDSNAGSIVLSQNGRILDYINYTNVDGNYSFGSFPDGQLVDRQQFYYVTPGAPNNGSPIPVIINEWLASNTNNIVDPATGKHEDWIELYNFGSATIDLSGYYLTDDTDKKKQWAFPEGTVITAGGYLLIWADNGATNSTPTSLHAAFALSKNGEQIALYNPDLLLVDRVTFGPQANDVSQGRYPDGNFSGVLHFMTTPTPGAANVVPANLNAPILPGIGDISVNEGSLLTFTNLATDADIPVQTLTYSLDSGAPSGATIDPIKGIFRWTPTEVQGGASYNLTIRVSDNGSPTLTDSKSFRITVNKVNSPPIVAPLAARSVPENTTVSFAVSASDTDLPVQTLTFSLDAGAPSGASIDSGTGVFTWTPNEAQGPSTNTILIRVTDNGSPSASTTQAVTITVTEVNSQPVLTNPGTLTIDEAKLFTYQLVATDADLPTNRLSFSSFGPIPAGLIVNAISGILSWTPTEAQGPSTNLVTVRVSDNGVPSMNMTQQFTIVVNEVNSAPVLTNLNNSTRTINELTTISLTNRATDIDVPTNILTYEIVSAPAGAAINATNGILTWTPTEAQGPSSNSILVRVYDNGIPSLSATQRFSIVVAEVNSAPTIPAIADKTVAPGQLLSFAVGASDPDLPAQLLSFNLEPGAPAGAAVDSAGIFSWTPPGATPQGTNQLAVRVADDGVPSLSATQTFKVIVTFAVRITDIHQPDATHLSVTFQTQAGKNYRLEYRDDLGSGADWQAVSGSDGTATGSSDNRTIVISGPAHRFFRIVQTN